MPGLPDGTGQTVAASKPSPIASQTVLLLPRKILTHPQPPIKPSTGAAAWGPHCCLCLAQPVPNAAQTRKAGPPQAFSRRGGFACTHCKIHALRKQVLRTGHLPPTPRVSNPAQLSESRQSAQRSPGLKARAPSPALAPTGLQLESLPRGAVGPSLSVPHLPLSLGFLVRKPDPALVP